jgi:hypothetical protein
MVTKDMQMEAKKRTYVDLFLDLTGGCNTLATTYAEGVLHPPVESKARSYRIASKPDGIISHSATPKIVPTFKCARKSRLTSRHP